MDEPSTAAERAEREWYDAAWELKMRRERDRQSDARHILPPAEAADDVVGIRRTCVYVVGSESGGAQ